MVEIELKLQVPPEARAALDAWVGAAGARRRRLQATYFDTPDRRLAVAGLALRIRKEGRQRVQTLKGPGADAMQRFEHNVELPFAAGSQPDAARHAGTPCGAQLAAVLAEAARAEPAQALQAQFRTDVWRRTRTLRARGGSVEVAYDSGEIVAGDRRWPVHEVEVELKSGRASAVVDVARRLMQRHGLWLDVTTKAERGDRLARHLAVAPAARARPLRLEPAMSADAAFRVVFGNCMRQILPNASEIAGGHGDDEHVHQLRVGLRRMRTALRFFDGLASPLPATWNERLAALFQGLGIERDRDALAESLLPSLQAAGAPLFDLPPPPEGPTPSELLRSADSNGLILDLIAWQAQVPAVAGPVEDLKSAVDERIGRWHRRVVRAGRRWAKLEDVERHALRKSAKRLRYAAEFAASLYDGETVARYLAQLAPVQDSLGRYNDLCVALQTYRAAVGDDPRAWFAIGWLTARRDVLLAESAKALGDFARAKAFWRPR
jgi:triphosphatase